MRGKRNCSLSGFSQSKWSGRELLPIYMGRPPDYENEGKKRDWFKPPDDPEEIGCPGGWYRCEFIRSLQKYRRPGGENRTENLLLSKIDDFLIIEAINYLEEEERHALSAFYEARDG